MEHKKLPGHIALFSANIIFGINNPISRTLMPEILSPYTLTFFRLSGGMILFWIVSLFIKKEKVPAKDILLLFFASLFALTLNQLPFFVGLSMTSPIDASIVVTMLPIVTMILAAIFIKEPITLMKAVGVLVGASGALLIVFNNNAVHAGRSNFWGNVIVFGAVASFAVYLTLFKNLITRYSPITIMKWMFLFGTIVCFPFCYKPIVQTDFALLTAGTYWRIAYVVLLATFLGYLLIPIGQKLLRPTTLSMYNYVQPIMASLVAIFIGIDSFGYEQALAAILVFSGVYIVTQSKSRAQMEEEKKRKKLKIKNKNIYNQEIGL
jgi:drug/metabolite transporter (DMT)-like permease